MHDTIVTIFPDEEFAADRERELQRIYQETVEVHGMFSVIHKGVYEQAPLIDHLDNHIGQSANHIENVHEQLDQNNGTQRKRTSCKWVVLGSLGIFTGGLILTRWLAW